MKFSVIIPAHNERDCIASTLDTLAKHLETENFDYEILVIADHCSIQHYVRFRQKTPTDAQVFAN